MLDPVTLTAAGGAVTTIGAFLAGRFLRNKRSTAPAAVGDKRDLAITDTELVAALAALRLPPDTVRLLRGKVQTMRQLEDTVAMMRAASAVSVQDKMLPCATAYMRRRYAKHADDVGRLLAVAQCGVPEVIHPAFQPIATDLMVVGEGLAKAMEAKLRQRIEPRGGPWFDRDKSLQGYARDKRRSAQGQCVAPHNVYSWDVLRPRDDGVLRVLRMTSYDSVGSVVSQWDVADFDAKGDNQPTFWLAFAKARIDELISGDPKRSIYVHGNLLEWTRFVEALQSQEPKEGT